MKHKVIDALIIGGGPAGATTGLLLAQAGWSVGIVEKKTFPRRKVCGEFLSATNLSLLQQVGIADFYLSSSGPEVRRVGLYATDVMLATPMPTSSQTDLKWGRALGREHLDTALLDKARSSGAILWQPAQVQNMERHENLFSCSIIIDDKIEKIQARIIVIAHGSWEHQLLQSTVKASHKDSDLLAFKAHFKNSNLAPDLMPLLAFPGGYGGLVHTDNGRITLSCCIRRDVLQQIRQQHPGIQAGDAVLDYIKTKCLGVKQVLTHAQREGNWLSCGPIQPGIRKPYKNGIFFVGNIAGEAHPIVAEGISMAMQSAWLLSQILIKGKNNLMTDKALNAMGKIYANQWRKNFAARIYAASLFAQFAMRPALLNLMTHSIKLFPGLLTFGAKLSGKIRQIVPVEKNKPF